MFNQENEKVSEEFLRLSLEQANKEMLDVDDAQSENPSGQRLFREIMTDDNDEDPIPDSELNKIYQEMMEVEKLSRQFSVPPEMRGESDAGESEEGEEGTEPKKKALMVPKLKPGTPTKDLINHEQFVADAKILWEKNKQSMNPYMDVIGELTTDEEFGQWGIDQMSGFHWNIPKMASMVNEAINTGDIEYAQALFRMMEMYDQSSGGANEFGRAVKYLMLDPTTYLGLGVGKLAAGMATRQLQKHTVSKAAKGSIIGGTAGMAEGGAESAGYSAARQNVQKEAGAIDKVSLSQIALEGGIGTAAGLFLGGAMGRWAGKMAARADNQVTIQDRVRPEQIVNEILDNDSGNHIWGKFLTTKMGKASGDDLDILRGITDLTPTQEIIRSRIIAGEKFDEVVLDVITDIVVERGGNSNDIDRAVSHLMGLNPNIRRDPSIGIELPSGKYMLAGPWWDETGKVDQNKLVEAFKSGQFDTVLDSKAHRVTYDGEASGGEILLRLEGKSAATGQDEAIFFEISPARKSPTGKMSMTITSSHTSALGEGRGKVMYNELINIARSIGADEIRSDNILSKHSRPMYEAIKANRKDVVVTRTPSDNLYKSPNKDGIDYWHSKDGKPIYTVRLIDTPENTVIPGPKGPMRRTGDTSDFAGLPIRQQIDKALTKDEVDPEVAGAILQLVDILALQGDAKATVQSINSIIDQIPNQRVQTSLRNSIDDTVKAINEIIAKDPVDPPGITPATLSHRGSLVQLARDGQTYEVIGRSSRGGWYKLQNVDSLEVRHAQMKGFDLIQGPLPRHVGKYSVGHIQDNSIIRMAEQLEKRKASPESQTQTWQMTREQARDLADKGIDITNKRLESYWTPAELDQLATTYEALLARTYELSQYLARVISGGQLDESGMIPSNKFGEASKFTVELASLNELMDRTIAVRDLLSGVTTNAARLLNIRKAMPDSSAYSLASQIEKSLKAGGGQWNTIRAINAINEAAATAKAQGRNVDKAIGDATRAAFGGYGWKGAVMNFRYNIMLSSLRTHFANLIGNASSGLFTLGVVDPVNITINKLEHNLRRALKSTGIRQLEESERLYWSEYAHGIVGIHNSMRDSIHLAKQIALGRDIGEGKMANELGLRYHIETQPTSTLGKIGHTPVRMVEAMDALFKNMYFNAKIYEHASRRARLETLGNEEAFSTKFSRHVIDPSEAAIKDASEFASRMTYTNDPSIYGTHFGAAVNYFADATHSSFVMNMLIPFVRTPANLMGFALRMVGVEDLMQPTKTYRAISQGSAAERSEALGRLAVAGGLIFYVHQLHSQGLITGMGPSNFDERRAWEAGGWQAGSIQFRGQYYDMARIEPAGIALLSIATFLDGIDMMETDEDRAAHIGTAVLMTSEFLLSKLFLSQLTDLFVAIDTQQDQKATSVAGSVITSYLAPGLIRDLRLMQDPSQRRLDSYTSNEDPTLSNFAQSMISRVQKQWQNAFPWASENLPPRRDWTGGIVNNHARAYWRGIVPLNKKDPNSTDPASAAVAYARVPVAQPARYLDLPGPAPVRLDTMAMDEGRGWVQDLLHKEVGEARKRMVNEVINSSEFKKLAAQDLIGPGSMGSVMLRQALAAGMEEGKARFIQYILNNDHVPGPRGEMVPIIHGFNPKDYQEAVQNFVRGQQKSEGMPQYKTKEARPGPRQFRDSMIQE